VGTSRRIAFRCAVPTLVHGRRSRCRADRQSAHACQYSRFRFACPGAVEQHDKSISDAEVNMQNSLAKGRASEGLDQVVASAKKRLLDLIDESATGMTHRLPRISDGDEDAKCFIERRLGARKSVRRTSPHDTGPWVAGRSISAATRPRYSSSLPRARHSSGITRSARRTHASPPMPGVTLAARAFFVFLLYYLVARFQRAPHTLAALAVTIFAASAALALSYGLNGWIAGLAGSVC
jgi:hypothetical protein